jgi:hypothetical protein
LSQHCSWKRGLSARLRLATPFGAAAAPTLLTGGLPGPTPAHQAAWTIQEQQLSRVLDTVTSLTSQ